MLNRNLPELLLASYNYGDVQSSRRGIQEDRGIGFAYRPYTIVHDCATAIKHKHDYIVDLVSTD